MAFVASTIAVPTGMATQVVTGAANTRFVVSRVDNNTVFLGAANVATDFPDNAFKWDSGDLDLQASTGNDLFCYHNLGFTVYVTVLSYTTA